MIQTAGTPGARRKRIRGPNAPSNAVVINARTLPNPHGKVVTNADNHIEKIQDFLRSVCPEKVKKLVALGCKAIENKKPVVVVCSYGRDRSRAIAHLIGDNFNSGEIFFDHREE
jgi:rhodanese-related sulfurtransferase